MNQPIEQFEHNGCQISIYRDEDPQSPDDWGNDDLFLIANHRQFSVQRKGFNCDKDTPKDHRKDYHVLPLYAYIHSGVALSLDEFSCPWDSGQVGWVLVGKRCGFRSISKAAKSLVSEWSSYLSGEVYGFVVEREGEQTDSCWGFVGDIKYCRDEAKAAAA